MALPALLARAVVWAARKWGPPLVGRGLQLLGVFEIGDLIAEAWDAIVGDAEEGRQVAAQAVEGSRTERDVPGKLLAHLSAALASGGWLGQDERDSAPRDDLTEEQLAADLERLEAAIERDERRDPAADLSVQILGRGATSGGSECLSHNHGRPAPARATPKRRRRRK